MREYAPDILKQRVDKIRLFFLCKNKGSNAKFIHKSDNKTLHFVIIFLYLKNHYSIKEIFPELRGYIHTYKYPMQKKYSKGNKKMKRYMLFLMAAALVLSGCAKGFEPLEHKPRDMTASIDDGFEYSAVYDIWEHKNKRYEHLAIEENAYKENKQEMLYDFDVKVIADNLKYIDNIGKILVGEDYDHDKWDIESFNYGTEKENKEFQTATYRSEDFQLICDSTSLMYIPKGKNFDTEILPPDAYDEVYPAVLSENAVEIINRLYKAMEKIPPEIYGAVYL
ncbi:MAG: hypothetical protein ACI4JW_07070 [Oscillospiraceae bacterium]